MALEALYDTIKSNSLKAVLYHWAEVKCWRQMPGWNDIRPSRVARQLPIIWAYTYDRATDTFTGRLAGDRIEAVFGKTFRQTPLEEIYPKSEYMDVFERAKRVIDEPAIYYSEGLVYRQLKNLWYGEHLIMPLADDGVHGDGILGCTECRSMDAPQDGSVSENEAWFPL